MEKTEMMKRYETKTGKRFSHMQKRAVEGDINCTMSTGYITWLETKANISDETIEAFLELIRNQCDEISALKEKAEAYDRLMSGGKKTLKELANIFGKPVATQKDGDAYVYMECPVLNKNGDWVGLYEGTCISMYLIGFTGDWKDSLTLPDGWEEA